MISCAVALVFLLDASASITARDWALQVEGHAAALEAQADTIQRNGPVAVRALAFSDTTEPMTEWRLLVTAEDARAAAAELRRGQRGDAMGTNIPWALRAARRALAEAPCQAEQEIIDLVTDGEADGPSTARERAYAEAEGVRINALGVGNPEAAEWLREHAATSGGFVLHAEGWGDFARAIARKITLEVASAGR